MKHAISDAKKKREKVYGQSTGKIIPNPPNAHGLMSVSIEHSSFISFSFLGFRPRFQADQTLDNCRSQTCDEAGAKRTYSSTQLNNNVPPAYIRSSNDLLVTGKSGFVS